MIRSASAQNRAGWQPQILDQLRSELGDDDGTMIAEIIALYLTQARKLLGQMTVAAGARDENQLRVLAHALKGSSWAVGGSRLAVLCQGVESGVDIDHPLALDNLREEFDRLTASLGAASSTMKRERLAETGPRHPAGPAARSNGAS